jgi:hypothetical protein
MRISLTVTALAFLVSLHSAADARFADQRSFFHPLGFWSNDGIVKQRKVYHPQWKFDAAPERYPHPGYEWGGSGGGVMHERNW